MDERRVQGMRTVVGGKEAGRSGASRYRLRRAFGRRASLDDP